MPIDYRRAPRPQGINNRSNEYYERRNHVRTAREEVSRSLFLTSTFSVSIVGLTDNPTYGQTAQIGVSLSYSTDPAQTVTAQRWFVGGVQVATTATYTPVAGDDLQTLYAEVDTAEETVRSPSYTVRYTPPTLSLSQTISGLTPVGSTLTTTNPTVTGVNLSYTYAWLRSGAVISGATANTYVTTNDDAGLSMTSRVTTSNSGGSVTSDSSNFITVDGVSPPVNVTPPSIPATGTIGQLLTATAGTWDGSPNPVVAGQWRKGTTAIPGETGLTYTPDEVRSDYNYYETATNSEGTVNLASGNCDVAAVAPVNNIAPSIAPTGGTIGVEITATPGDWNLGNPTATISPQWLRDGSPIGGETGLTYTPAFPDDNGAQISYRERATNPGNQVDAISNVVQIETLGAPVNTDLPTITPTSTTVDDGPVFTRGAGVWSGSPAPTVTWVWRKGTTPIPGTENAPTLLPTGAADAVANFNVLETANNGVGGDVTAASLNASASLRAQATMSLQAQSFTENTGLQTYDMATDTVDNGNSLTWALTLFPAGVTHTGSVLEVDTNSLPVGSYPINAEATDEYGRVTPGSLSLDITDASGAIDPTFLLGIQVPGSNGNPDSVGVTSWSKNGSTDTHTLYAATTVGATPPTKDQIKNGGGTVVERDSAANYDGEAIVFSNFTNDAVGYVHAIAEEDNNGGSSDISTAQLVDIDFTPLQIVSAETNAGGDIVSITFDDDITGTIVAGDFAIPGRTIGGASAGGTTSVDLTGILPVIQSGDTDTFNYTQGNLADQRGNLLETSTGNAIVNNVGPFHPSQLFESGEEGFYIEAGTGMYTSADNSVPAGDGDLVQFVEDQSGQSGGPCNFSQATSARRPTLVNDAGTWRLSIDCVAGEHLLSSLQLGYGAEGVTIMVRTRTTGIYNPSATIIGGRINSDVYDFYFRRNPERTWRANTWNAGGLMPTLDGAQYAVDTDYTSSMVMRDTDVKIYTTSQNDGAEDGSVANDGTFASGTTTHSIGPTGTSGGGPVGILLQAALVINRPLSQAERLDLQTYMEAL